MLQRCALPKISHLSIASFAIQALSSVLEGSRRTSDTVSEVTNILIILEGPDNAGKTTAAHQIMASAERHGFTTELWHRGVPKRHPLQEYEHDLELEYRREDPSHLLVCDRWHLGQLVYGGLYRDNNLLGAHGAWHVDQFLQSRGALQIIMDQPDDVLIERDRIEREEGKAAELTSEDAGYLQAEHIAYVASAYRGLSLRCSRTVSTITGIVTPAVASTLVRRVRDKQTEAYHLKDYPSYVGSPTPDILLVGDKKGHAIDKRHVSHVAAFAPYGGTSGEWLAKTIVESGLQLYRLGVINANEDDVSSLIRHTKEAPLVVALGFEASTALHRQGVQHGRVPHPQYGRRFHYQEREAYARAIVTAAQTQEVVRPWRT